LFLSVFIVFGAIHVITSFLSSNWLKHMWRHIIHEAVAIIGVNAFACCVSAEGEHFAHSWRCC